MCNILDINLLWIFFFDHVLFDMKLLNYLFCDMFGSVLECYELTLISAGCPLQGIMHDWTPIVTPLVV